MPDTLDRMADRHAHPAQQERTSRSVVARNVYHARPTLQAPSEPPPLLNVRAEWASLDSLEGLAVLVVLERTRIPLELDRASHVLAERPARVKVAVFWIVFALLALLAQLVQDAVHAQLAHTSPPLDLIPARAALVLPRAFLQATVVLLACVTRVSSLSWMEAALLAPPEPTVPPLAVALALLVPITLPVR